MTAVSVTLSTVTLLIWGLVILFRAARSARLPGAPDSGTPARSAAGLAELVLTVEAAILALDERVERLDRLVGAADAAADRLERALGAAASADYAQLTAATTAPAAAVAVAGAPAGISEVKPVLGRGAARQRPARTRVARVAQLGGSAAAGEEAAPATTALAPLPPVAESSAPAAQSSRPKSALNEVYRLDDAGLSPEAIAEHLSIPRGEVQLILGLRRFG